MAILKATQLSPQNIAIDGTEDNIFSWVYNGAVQTAYRVYIYDNDTDSLLFDSNRIDSENQYYTLPASSINNALNCKWCVETWSYSTYATSEYEFFLTNTTPTVLFLNPDFSGGLNQVIESFQDNANWVSSGNGTKAEETVTILSSYGTKAVRLTDTSSASIKTITKTVSHDLTMFDNGVASTLSDNIYLAYYCSDVPDYGIRIRFISSGGNYYNTFTGNYVGWNYQTMDKNSFSVSGTPDWSAITSIELGWNDSTPDSTTYVIFQAVEIRKVATGTSIIIATQDYEFEMSYYQSEDISLKKFKYILYDANSTIITDTGWQYGYDTKYTFIGLSNYQAYKIKGICVSQNDQECETFVGDVYVMYLNTNVLPNILATPSDDEGSVTIDWSNIIYKNITYTQATPIYVTGKFNYGFNVQTSYEIEIDDVVGEDFTITAWIKLKNNINGDFCQINNAILLGYDSTTRKFYINNNGVYSYSEITTLFNWSDLEADQLIVNPGYSGSWTGVSTDTWLTVGIDTVDYLDDYIFIGITANDVIIKKNNELIAHIAI